MRSSKPLILFAALLVLGIVGWFDYITGYEVSVFVLYAVPVAMVAWSMGGISGFGASVLSTSVWMWVNFVDGRPYSHNWILLDRFVNGLLLLSFIAFSFSYFRRTIDRGRRRINQLEGILPICSRCQRIRDGDEGWTEMATYIKEHTDAHPQSRLCPDCARVGYAANYRTPSPSAE